MLTNTVTGLTPVSYTHLDVYKRQLEKVKTEDGWADEIMAHMIRCKHCGQIFTCVVNTWRGSEHFRKGKGSK